MRLRPTLNAAWRRLRFVLTPRPRYVHMGGYGIATTWRGDRILVPAGDTGLAAYLATSGRWEVHIERLMSRLIRPGDMVVDAGANVGYHALGMARAVGPAGRVHAFEANPRLRPLLIRTIEMAGYRQRIALHSAALSDRAGTATFAFDPEFVAGGHLDLTGAPPAGFVVLDTPTVRLDDALADSPACALLRMDLEGSEGAALLGAERLIARSPGLVIISEWSSELLRQRCDLPGLIGRLEAWGFRARVLSSEREPQPLALRALAEAELPTATDILLTRG